MQEFLSAPTPYIMGIVLKGNKRKPEFDEDVVQVDLDRLIFYSIFLIFNSRLFTF